MAKINSPSKMSGRCLLLVISLLVLSFEHGISHASAIIRFKERERKALIDFKRGLRDPSNRLSSWVGEDCCTWEGVACSNFTHGHVVKLDLRNPHRSHPLRDCFDDADYYSWDDDLGFDDDFGCKWMLRGRINPSLLSLEHLNHLDLSGNYFQRNHIPKFLGSFRRLTYLNLSGAGFTGRVPAQLGNLSTLRRLDLSYNCYNDYGDCGCLYLESPGWISRLTSLRHLNMNSVRFRNPSIWLQALNVLPYIEKVELAGCDLGTIPRSLPHLNFTSLTTLDLGDNDINSTVPDWLFNITSLEYLDLGWNSLSGLLPTSICNLASLRMLGLSGNLFHNDGFALKDLSNLCKIHMLRMSYVPIKDVLANVEVVFSRCLMFSLEELDLRGTQLSGSLPDWLGNIRNLKYLDLSYNSLHGSVPASLGNLSLLQYLNVRSNYLNGTIAQGIGQLKGLVRLYLGNNSFNLWEVHLSNLSNLKYLGISYNSLVLKQSHDWIPPFQLKTLHMAFCQRIPRPYFPKWLQKQRTLLYLDVSSNNLNGAIAEGIGQMKSLVTLYISNISLSLSEIHLANLSSLKYLDISYNSLAFNESHDWIPPFQLTNLYMSFCKIVPTAHFPKWLRTQKTLASLDLSNAGIEDTIPNWLPSNLESLYLSNNEITGEVPQHFSKLTNLDLSNNSLAGHLPLRMANSMPKLNYLDLSMNNLSGSIPLSLCEIKSWFMLRLSNNNLSGKLPNCWKNSSQLFMMDFSSNNLNGGFPNSLCTSRTLQSLHLSNNNLSGKIPFCLKSCTSLVTLDLGHNKFIGNISNWIGESLSHLKTLSLRSNAFTGSIFQLSHLASLQILDLSDNDFSGTIPSSFGNLSALKGSPQDGLYFDTYSYYDDDMWLLIKGSELEYKRLLPFVKVIDLSNNNLSGYIPEELENLNGLQSLNLSWNHLTGEIPININRMQQLEGLDLSRNNLSGAIPWSLATLTFLNHLNLSYNNLSGQIPTGNQLQTLIDPSIYIGNLDLCGPPLTRNCTNDMTKDNEEEQNKGTKSKTETIWSYTSIALGFIMGFWTFCGTLLFQRRCRIVYFRAIDSMCDTLYALMAVNMAKLKRELFIKDQDD